MDEEVDEPDPVVDWESDAYEMLVEEPPDVNDDLFGDAVDDEGGMSEYRHVMPDETEPISFPEFKD